MHLVAPLVSGIRGAENGTAKVYRRGTTTRVLYYQDFEASQALTVDVALDSNGAAEVYVNELVDVYVYTSSGQVARQFTAGAAAGSVEVISQSFTGIDYASGASGTSKPTTLQTVLDGLLASFGASGFNVLFQGSSVTLQTALASIGGFYFNVKSPAYGAVGDGTTDDTTAIADAISAAAAGGGVVFFPAGTYRITSALTRPYNVSFLGSGAVGTVIHVDGAAINGINNTGGGREPAFIQDISIRPAQNNTGSLVNCANSNYSLVLKRCALRPGSGAVNGYCVQLTATNASITLEDCLIETTGTQTAVGNAVGFTPVGDIKVLNCLFRKQGTGSATFIEANTVGSAVVLGCSFEALSSTAGYTGVSLSVSDGVTALANGAAFGLVAGCRFPNPTSGTSTGILFIQEGFEFGNTFGSLVGVIRNSAFANAAGSIEHSFFGSEMGRHRKVAEATTAHTITDGFGRYTIIYTGGGDLTLTLPSANETSREFLLIVHNDTAVNRVINLPAATRPNAAVAVNANSFSGIIFRAVYVNGTAYWTSQVLFVSQAE